MDLVIESVVPGARLRVAGEVDVRTVADLRQELLAAIDAGIGDLVVDCDGLHLVDATGLGALLSAHRRAQRAGRRLVLNNVQADLSRLLHVSRLSRLLSVARRPAA